MKRFYLFLAVAGLAVLAPASAAAATFTYSGAAGGTWNSAANWTLNTGTDADGIPDSDDDVTISANSVQVPASTTVACNNITLTNGATRVSFGDGASVLDVFGTLNSDTAVTTANIIDNSANSSKVVFKRSTNGAIFGANWSANTTGLRFEVDVSTATVTNSSTSVAAREIIVTSGTFSMSGGDLRPNSDVATSGILTINTAGTLTVTTRLSRTGAPDTPFASFTINGSGVFKTTSGSAPVWPTATTSTFSAGSTVEYSGTAQTIQTANYGNLKLSNSGLKTVVAAGTVSIQTNGGLEMSGGASPATFSAGTGTFSVSSIGTTIKYTATGAQITGTEWDSNFQNALVNKVGTNSTVTLGASKTLNGTLTVTSGVLDQGASFDLATGAVTVSSGGRMQNTGSGDLTLSGDVSNSGSINYNSGGATCGDADTILINSSVGGTSRAWSGSGSFSMGDVTVSDQGGTAPITVIDGTNAGGNGANWIFVAGCLSGQTYTWNGPTGPDTSYATPTNWTPSRLVPNTADVLIVDGATKPAPTISSVPTQTIAQLRIVNGTQATMTTSAANTLTIAGSNGSDFVINGSQLTLSGSSGLKISVATGATGSINANGIMIVQSGPHRLIAADADAVTLQSTAKFTTNTGFTGNPFGTGGAGDGANGSIIFASGSIYFHNAGLSPFGTAGLGPVAVFQTGSEADWLTTTGFQASGRTYANLVIGKGDPGGVAVKVTDSGSSNFQFDNLAINHTGSADSELEFTGTGSSTVTIQGNITSVGSGTGSTLWDVNLTAGGGIVISEPNNGTITFGNLFSAAKGIRFESNATLATGTTLNLARILQMGISPTNILTANGTIVPNFSGTQGYVVGGVRKTPVPNGAYTFHVGTLPVGATSGYTPVDLANATGGGDLTVRPVDSDAPVVDPAKSLDEYWKLTLNSGSLTTDVTFNYLQGDVSGNESLYRIIRVSGSTAVSFPNACPSGSACVDTTNNKAIIKGLNSFSDWTLGEPAAPTVARLTRINAASYSDGVELNWDTGFEVNNLGYHIYREENGRRTRVTPSEIAGSALTVGVGRRLTAGYSYSWFDPQGTRDSVYSLEAIDLDGSSEWFGEIYPNAAPNGGKRRKAPKHERAILLNEIGADNGDSSNVSSWPAAMKGAALSTTLRLTNDEGRQREAGQIGDSRALSNAGVNSKEDSGSKEVQASLAVQQAIAAGKAVKIQVRKSGWYRLTQAELVAAGFDPSSDARMLQLYVDGVEVPISLSTEGVRLSANDTMEFYGVPLDTPTTDTRVYWLISGNSSGKRMIASRGKLKPADPNTDVVSGSFDVTTERRDRLVYLSSLLNGDSENMFGSSVRSNSVSKTLVLKNVAGESVSQPSLEVALQGFTTGAHMVQLQVNGTNVGTMTFADSDHPVAKFPISPELLREGDNTVSLTSMNGQSDISLIHWMRLTYPRKYIAENNSLVFSAPGGQPVKVEGFSSPNIRVVDVTDPNLPTQLSGYGRSSGGGFEVRVQPAGPGARTLIAFTDDQMTHPVSIAANQPSSWNADTNGADLVIITHKNFRQAIEPLASLRRSQGLSVAVVDVEDIYDEFSYGAHTPAAIKSFMTTAASSWSRKPAYLLLVGDSSWDPRNYLNLGENDFVPTKLIDTRTLETGSDDWFADFNDSGLASMAIGRLPARTAAEVNLMVSKIISYERERDLNAPPRGAVMVADRGFEEQSTQTFALLPFNMTVKAINRAEVGNDDIMRGQIVDALNQGPMIVNYYGHGSVRVWTGNGLLTPDLAANLTNNNRLSLYVMMTCLNGYASDANIDSLGEATLKAPNGGAVAVWASSGFTAPEPQFEMNREFYRLLFRGQPIRLGDAIRGAKAATSDMDVRRTWVLLGDPALRIR